MSERDYFLTTREAAAYLGYKTSSGIRNLVMRCELEPDGIGARKTLLFRKSTLDDLACRRLELKRRLAAPNTSKEDDHG